MFTDTHSHTYIRVCSLSFVCLAHINTHTYYSSASSFRPSCSVTQPRDSWSISRSATSHLQTRSPIKDPKDCEGKLNALGPVQGMLFRDFLSQEGLHQTQHCGFPPCDSILIKPLVQLPLRPTTIRIFSPLPFFSRSCKRNILSFSHFFPAFLLTLALSFYLLGLSSIIWGRFVPIKIRDLPLPLVHHPQLCLGHCLIMMIIILIIIVIVVVVSQQHRE